MRAIGHATASTADASMGTSWPAQPTVPSRSRSVVAVAETGLSSAIVPSQVGMVAGSTKTLERKAMGQTRICT